MGFTTVKLTVTLDNVAFEHFVLTGDKTDINTLAISPPSTTITGLYDHSVSGGVHTFTSMLVWENEPRTAKIILQLSEIEPAYYGEASFDVYPPGNLSE